MSTREESSGVSTNPTASPAPVRTGRYPKYVLAILILVYVMSYVDRMILSVLAEDIKRDLQLSDAHMGFLFGTAFAVFYATLGLPLAALADSWNRKRLIAIGLSVWSLMTTLSGTAKGLGTLTLYRFGVGAGEASASPAAYSMLYDYYPPRVRTTVLSLYSSGLFIGQGIGIFFGGWFLQQWHAFYPDPAMAPFGLKGWQAAFMVVGLPGFVLAFFVANLKEPERGGLDGTPTPQHPHPIRSAALLLGQMIPPTSFWLIWSRNGWRPLLTNLFCAALIVPIAAILSHATKDVEQWAALGIGTYAVLSWVQTLYHQDQSRFRAIFGNHVLLLVIGAGGAANFMLSGFVFWSIPYLQRVHGLSTSEVGLVMGGGAVLMGLAGVTSGGILADYLYRRRANGKLFVVLISLCGSLSAAGLFLSSSALPPAYAGAWMLLFFSSAGLGPGVSIQNDIVPSHMRATTSAFSFLVTYLMAGALGPYLIGKLSDAIAASGQTTGEALRTAMSASLAISLIGIVLIVVAIGKAECWPRRSKTQA